VTIRQALERGLGSIDNPAPVGDEYDEALLVACPSQPEEMREKVRGWIEDQDPGYLSVLDSLMSSLNTIHMLMRIAHEEGEVCMVEVIEYERETLATQAAVALENRPPLKVPTQG
jgi:hypothetical protein